MVINPHEIIMNSGMDVPQLKHVFSLLASAELGELPSWTPDDAAQLRRRIETLALLLDIIPRSGLSSLDAILRRWIDDFPHLSPVTAERLRSGARAVLGRWDAYAPIDGIGINAVRRAHEVVRSLGSRRTLDSTAPEESEPLDELEAESSCTFGLSLWFDHLTMDSRWTHLPSIVPGEAKTPMDEIYVELFAIAEHDTSSALNEYDASVRTSRRILSSQYPAVSALTMIARTLERCVVTGEPGCGKSTLVQWLARAIFKQECKDFDAALVVKLSAFAEALASAPDCSLLEFFFKSLGPMPRDWKSAARWLRKAAAERRRFLLLLDGWDEIPIDLRETVHERIAFEAPYFTMVITSRPSGLPHQLLANDGGSVYHIAGLTARTKEELTKNLLVRIGRVDLVEHILSRITNEPDLDEMAGNPFLLSLLVRVLARTDVASREVRSLADLYMQIVSWVQESYNVTAKSEALSTEHFVALRRLCHVLLFDTDQPRYVFRAQELTEQLAGIPETPVLRSRFVNRIDPVFDEYTFLHATFQEYFAAVYASALGGKELESFIEASFRSLSRLIVLQFLGGMGGRGSEQCRRKAAIWLAKADRFRQVPARVARLASSGRWKHDDPEGINSTLRGIFRNDIRHNTDHFIVRTAVESYALLDASDLCRFALGAGNISNWAIECITNSVPKAIIRKEGFDRLLSGEWGDYFGMQAAGGATTEQKASIRAVLTSPTADRADRREAVIRAGAARDEAAIPMLLKFIEDEAEDETVREKAVESLGTIGNRAAVDILVSLLTGDRSASEPMANMAVWVLRHTGHNAKALDPVGRDQLIRRLAVLPIEDRRLLRILSAIERHPVRDGAELITEFVLRKDVGQELKLRAALTLSSVSDRELVEQGVSTITEQEDRGVATSLLHAALDRSMIVDIKWLQERIAAARDVAKRREFVIAFMQMLPRATGLAQSEGWKYLNRLIGDVLVDKSGQSSEAARLLDQGISLVDPGLLLLWPNTLRLARVVLADFAAAKGETSFTHLMLAARIIGHAGSRTGVEELRNALDKALKMIDAPKKETLPKVERVAESIASALAKISPEVLLEYPEDCGPVESILRSLTSKRGWLIFRDRIVDAEGKEIAATVRPVVGHAARQGELGDLIKKLSPRSGAILYSFWLMVKESGPCRPSDSMAAIYGQLKAAWSNDDDLDETLRHLFKGGGFPTFATWKRTLERLRHRFEKEPELLKQLARIGLGPRRSGDEL